MFPIEFLEVEDQETDETPSSSDEGSDSNYCEPEQSTDPKETTKEDGSRPNTRPMVEYSADASVKEGSKELDGMEKAIREKLFHYVASSGSDLVKTKPVVTEVTAATGEKLKCFDIATNWADLDADFTDSDPTTTKTDVLSPRKVQTSNRIGLTEPDNDGWQTVVKKERVPKRRRRFGKRGRRFGNRKH